MCDAFVIRSRSASSSTRDPILVIPGEAERRPGIHRPAAPLLDPGVRRDDGVVCEAAVASITRPISSASFRAKRPRRPSAPDASGPWGGLHCHGTCNEHVPEGVQRNSVAGRRLEHAVIRPGTGPLHDQRTQRFRRSGRRRGKRCRYLLYRGIVDDFGSGFRFVPKNL